MQDIIHIYGNRGTHAYEMVDICLVSVIMY